MTTALLRKTAIRYIHKSPHNETVPNGDIYIWEDLPVRNNTFNLLINLPSDLVPMHVPVPNNPDSNQVSPPSPPLPVQIRVEWMNE